MTTPVAHTPTKRRKLFFLRLRDPSSSAYHKHLRSPDSSREMFQNRHCRSNTYWMSTWKKPPCCHCNAFSNDTTVVRLVHSRVRAWRQSPTAAGTSIDKIAGRSLSLGFFGLTKLTCSPRGFVILPFVKSMLPFRERAHKD